MSSPPITQGESFASKDPTDELLNSIGTLVDEFRHKAAASRSSKKEALRDLTRSYKAQLRSALAKLEEEPASTADLVNPTDVFESLTEQQKIVKRKGVEELQELSETFKTTVSSIVGPGINFSENPIRIPLQVSWITETSVLPRVEFDPKTGEAVNFFWINSQANWTPTTWSNFDPRTSRLSSGINRCVNRPLPFQIGTPSQAFVPLGQNPEQDAIWKEMLDYLRPFRLF